MGALEKGACAMARKIEHLLNGRNFGEGSFSGRMSSYGLAAPTHLLKGNGLYRLNILEIRLARWLVVAGSAWSEVRVESAYGACHLVKRVTAQDLRAPHPLMTLP